MGWQALNLTWNLGARVDISLYGYWEDADKWALPVLGHKPCSGLTLYRSTT